MPTQAAFFSPMLVFLIQSFPATSQNFATQSVVLGAATLASISWELSRSVDFQTHSRPTKSECI